MVRRLLLSAVAVSAVLVALLSAPGTDVQVAQGQQPVARAAAAPVALNHKRACVYAAAPSTGPSISALAPFSKLVGREVDCAMVFNGAATSWDVWAKPWFVNYKSNPDLNWSAWATAKPGRLLIISQNLFPSSARHTNWLGQGAAGKFTAHATTLARNLVAAGLGSSIIRLAHEANGDWYDYSVGKSKRAAKLWVKFWRKTALAMRAVPGAHFRFDWTVNSEVTRLPLSRFYPGDDIVDIVGIDAYDVNVPKKVNRWNRVYSRNMGIRQVLNFAKAHGKSFSLPEWGVAPPRLLGGGDDPGYVNGVARVVRTNKVAYQAYFYAYDWAQVLSHGRKSLAAYRHHFGAHGDSVGR